MNRSFATVKALTGKELRQLRRSRGAILSTIVVPVVLLAVVPLPLIVVFSALPQVASPLPATLVLRLLTLQQSSQVLTEVLLPLLVAVTGLGIPTVTAVQLVVAERERRSFELVAALPVRVEELFLAKFVATLLLALAITLPLLVLQATALIIFDQASLSTIGLLGLLLIAALLCSTGIALLVALLARDSRTASNLAGLAFAFVFGVLVVLLIQLSGAAKLLAITALLVGIPVIAVVVAIRWVTFEAYLQN